MKRASGPIITFAAVLVCAAGLVAASEQRAGSLPSAGTGKPEFGTQNARNAPAAPERAKEAAPGAPIAPGEFEVGVLHLQTGDVRTTDLFDARSQGFFHADRRHVIQLDGPITPEKRAAIEAAGAKLADYLPAYAYIADLAGARADQLANLDFVIWTGEYQDAWKLSPEVGQRPYFTPERQAIAAQGDVAVMVYLFSGADRRPVLLELEAIGAQVHFVDQTGPREHVIPMISATMPLDRVPQLALLNEVQFVEDAWEITPRRNDAARWVVQTNVQGPADLLPLYVQGLRGEGQIAGIMDTAMNINHCSISDSVPPGPAHRKIEAYNATGSAATHGNHVSATVLGDNGSWTDNLRGHAYMARMVYHNWPSFTEGAATTRLQLQHDLGGRMHSNSWGNDGTVVYDGLARAFDVFQWNNEESQTFLAVTNTSTLKNPENAKNLMAVGATQKAPNQHNHATGGSGPTNDGRRKPEIYAPGQNTVSANTTSCGTSSLTGTSMACPAVTGVGILVRQYYMEGFYPTGEADSGDAFTPSGALVKATLLNSPVPMTGSPGGYPNNQQGWGRLLIQNSLRFIDSDRKLYVVDVRNADGLSTGGEYTDEIFVEDSSQELRVTLVWTDFPGALNANPAYVNNLDLEVEGPGGIYLGNVFNTTTGYSVTGGSADFRNNVEQVRINNPDAGPWTIRVKGTAVNQSTQGFALVVTGDISVQEPPLSVSVVGGVPSLVPAGEPFSFSVRIRPGAENIVPGSELLHYRYDGGSWISVPLVHDEGEFYTANLPGALCDDEPQYWVSAEGDGGTIRTAPSNAPAGFFSTVIGTIEINEVYNQQVTGPGLPTGWTSTGLWNVTSSCAVGTPCVPGPWAYYGQVATCNFNTGAANQGQMLSNQITLPSPPPGGQITIEFCYTLETENHQSYDIARFSIPGSSIDVRLNESPTQWSNFAVDATALAGQTVQLRWHFDTVDGAFNNFRGWQVDNVRITAAGLVCENPEPQCPADLNSDGDVDVLDLLLLLDAWGPNPGHAADLNGDGSVDVLDLLLLLDAWGPCT
jgi:hypothetical protein